MASLVALLSKISDDRVDDDFADRLNHRVTGMILIVFAVLISTTQYVGNPIECWSPVHFEEWQEKYVDDYCWIRNTYYLPFDENIPRDEEDDKRHMITYYQWMPLILLVQALLFNLPIIAWRSLAMKSGVDINNIISTALAFEAKKADSDEKEKVLKVLCQHMDRYLENSNHEKTRATISVKHCFSRLCCVCCGHTKGNYMNMLYLFCKLLFILNVVGQLLLMNFLLNHKFSNYGFDVLSSIIAGEDWTQSERFPRVTMCDLKVRRLGNVHRYTVQCVLPINLFNEKIYLFLWWWFVMVAAITCVSFCNWLARVVFTRDRYIYVRKHLHLSKTGIKLSHEDKRNLVIFVEKYLRWDGVFMLELLSHNTNMVTVDEITTELYKTHREKIEDGRDGTLV